MCSTEKPWRIFIPSSAAERTRSALAPCSTNNTCQNADFARSSREMSPARRNEPASARTDDRLITVRSRSKNAALANERQRACEPTGPTCVDRVGDRRDLRRHVRVAGVGGVAKLRVERDVAEERHAELAGEALAATRAEDLRRHVLDHADDAHPGLLGHG